MKTPQPFTSLLLYTFILSFSIGTAPCLCNRWKFKHIAAYFNMRAGVQTAHEDSATLHHSAIIHVHFEFFYRHSTVPMQSMEIHTHSSIFQHACGRSDSSSHGQRLWKSKCEYSSRFWVSFSCQWFWTLRSNYKGKIHVKTQNLGFHVTEGASRMLGKDFEPCNQIIKGRFTWGQGNGVLSWVGRIDNIIFHIRPCPLHPTDENVFFYQKILEKSQEKCW